jgi:hypothetical protein
MTKKSLDLQQNETVIIYKDHLENDKYYDNVR